MKSQGLTRKHVGLVWGNKKIQFLVALSGMFLGTIEYTILQPKPLIAVLDPVTLISASIILIISTGLAEELLFRGIIQKNAENVFGTVAGLLYTAFLFTALHIGWNSFPDLIFVFSVAIFYGYHLPKNKKHCWYYIIPRNIKFIPIFNNTILCHNIIPYNMNII